MSFTPIPERSDATPGLWNSRFEELDRGGYSVRAFGAAGDGTTDDTSSIRSAIAAAVSDRSSNIVFFPAGRYLITSTVTLPQVQLVGEGPATATAIVKGFSGNVFSVAADRVEFRELDFQGSGSTFPSGALIRYSLSNGSSKEESCIQRCSFRDFAGEAVYVEGDLAARLRIYDVYWESDHTSGIFYRFVGRDTIGVRQRFLSRIVSASPNPSFASLDAPNGTFFWNCYGGDFSMTSDAIENTFIRGCRFVSDVTFRGGVHIDGTDISGNVTLDASIDGGSFIGNLVTGTFTNNATNMIILQGLPGSNQTSVIDSLSARSTLLTKLGLGTLPLASRMVTIVGSGTAGTAQHGISSNFASQNDATTQTNAIVVAAGTVAANYTCATVAGLRVSPNVRGSGSTINVGVGVVVEAQAAGLVNFAFQSQGTTPSQFGGGIQVTESASTSPSYGFSSESSLGWYRSGVSTVALSYGSFNMNQGRLVSVRTTASLDSTSLAVNEMAFSVVQASGASLAIRSGSTIWYFSSSASTRA